MFDGSGGFPLAASLCGIDPSWASEVEPYPIAVTRSRFPTMKHLGDISKINGAEIEPVDIITFGSPCQDLSVAGKRAGLEGARSGLFMEAVRIIKEMREATDGKYPRFALWENVPGAFSSNKGEDFRVVLEELIKIVEEEAVMPQVPSSGWAYADTYSGDGWSLAYRVFDAQYWGVPQRRRRIYLVADFRGESAGKILFERDGLRGHLAPGGTPEERATSDVEGGFGADDSAGEGVIYGFDGYYGTDTGDKAATLGVNCGMSTGRDGVVLSAGFKAGQGINARGIGWEDEKCPTLAAEAGGNSIPSVCVRCFDARGNGNGDIAPTITGDHNGHVSDYTAVLCMATQQGGAEIMEEKCPTITAAAGMSGNNQPVICCQNTGQGWWNQGEIAQTLRTPCGGDSTKANLICEPIPIHDQATRFSGKRGDKRDGKGNGLGVGSAGEPVNTLTNGDRHAVAYGVDCRNGTEYPNLYPTLQAKSNGGQSLNFSGAVRTSMWDGSSVSPTITASNADGSQRMPDIGHFNCVVECESPTYVVRRLTPTECARLQGFPDKWGHPEQKSDFSNDEYMFWLDVRNTHAEINGKNVKEYTKDQILKWYNKLHSDSAEYKMWGNGIALPPSLYCMQGMAEALTHKNMN